MKTKTALKNKIMLMYIMCHFNELEKNINNLVPIMEYFDTNYESDTDTDDEFLYNCINFETCNGRHNDLYDPYCDNCVNRMN